MNVNNIVKCKNCSEILNYALIPDLSFECVICKHNMSAFYGVWHCPNECNMDICPLCSLGSSFNCLECKGSLSFIKLDFFRNSKIFQCKLCQQEFLIEDGAHFCYACKSFFCCIRCRSQQNDLYNRDSIFYKSSFF